MISTSGIVHISEMTSLALHGMAFIAASKEPVLSAKVIAEATGASEAHLAKVFQRLVKTGLACSERGPKGGYSLAKPPEEIALLDVYQSMEGITEDNKCPLKRGKCPFNQCLFEGFLKKMEEEFTSFFAQRSLADISIHYKNNHRNSSKEKRKENSL